MLTACAVEGDVQGGLLRVRLSARRDRATPPGEKAADDFFGELIAERSTTKLRAISMDMGPGCAKSAGKKNRAPQPRLYIDSYHVVALAAKALDEAHRDHWNQLRSLGDQQAVRRFQGRGLR